VGRIVVTEFITVDGVIEDPGGVDGFERGGWSADLSEEGGRFKFDEAMATDALLLGRQTYQDFAQAWPARDGEFADRFNTVPKYVVSSTLEDPEWNNSTVLRGDLGEEVATLRQRHEGDVVVHGSAQLVRALVAEDQVDELRLMVFPVVLGSGRRLFADARDKKPLTLAECKAVGDGVAVLIYRPA
jgi:dihydrofolate reductase